MRQAGGASGRGAVPGAPRPAADAARGPPARTSNAKDAANPVASPQAGAGAPLRAPRVLQTRAAAPRHAHAPPRCRAQPCLEGKNLGRKQTLTYLKGYANESDPVMSAGEPRAPRGGGGGDAPAAAPAQPGLAFAEPWPAAALGESLPKWVENDRKARARRAAAPPPSRPALGAAAHRAPARPTSPSPAAPPPPSPARRPARSCASTATSRRA